MIRRGPHKAVMSGSAVNQEMRIAQGIAKAIRSADLGMNPDLLGVIVLVQAHHDADCRNAEDAMIIQPPPALTSRADFGNSQSELVAYGLPHLASMLRTISGFSPELRELVIRIIRDEPAKKH